MDKEKVMIKETLAERSKRFKEKAKIFLEEDTKAWVKDIRGTFYFCNIIKVRKNHMLIQSFAGKRDGDVDKIYFVDVIDLLEFKTKESVSQ